MDDLEEVIWLYRMNCTISQNNRVKTFENDSKQKLVPTENCRPFMDAWLQCTNTKDNCCGGKKCKFFFVNWQNCHKYNNEVREHNDKMKRVKKSVVVGYGTYNGLSAK